MELDTTSASVIVAVTSSASPYIADLPQLLALPPGFEHRLRYKPRWVAPDLRSEIAYRKGDLTGARVLVLFHSVERGALLPVRWGRLSNIEQVGPFVHVRLCMGGFALLSEAVDSTSHPPSRFQSACYPDQRARIAAAYGEVGRTVLGIESVVAGAKLPEEVFFTRRRVPEALLVESNTAASDPLENSRSWAEVATAVVDEPRLAGRPLFYVAGFQDDDGGYADTKPSRTNSMDESPGALPSACSQAFALMEGQRYRLRVVQWAEPSEHRPLAQQRAVANSESQAPPDCPPVADAEDEALVEGRAFRVTAEVSPRILEVEGASDLVLGRYDVLETSLVAGRPGSAELTLREDSVRRADRLSLRIPIQVAPDWKRLLRWAGAGGLGVGVAIWGSQKQGGFGFAVAAVGATIVSVALEGLFRRKAAS